MSIVAVICEYNPFHLGHAYQLEKIRECLGADTGIVALMSGNFTQRADVAIADKFTRAASAVMSGADLVLEIPFPFSSASAQLYATAGVRLAASLGICDTLAFGSECGDKERLCRVAENLSSPALEAALAAAVHERCDTGYPRLLDETYRALFGDKDATLLCSPNDTLAVEYLRALAGVTPGMKPLVIPRTGAAYHNRELPQHGFASASSIRRVITADATIPVPYLTPEVAHLLETERCAGRLPADIDRLSTAILSYFMLNSPPRPNIHDAEDGLYFRLCKYAHEATSVSSLCDLSATKKYTRARVRRAILFSFFGVTSSDVKSAPAYTQLLGATKRGLSLLKQSKTKAGIPILTKPSDKNSLSAVALRQKALSDRADELYGLCLPTPRRGADAYRISPFIVK